MLTEKEGSWEEKDYAETPENKQAHKFSKEKSTGSNEPRYLK